MPAPRDGFGWVAVVVLAVGACVSSGSVGADGQPVRPGLDPDVSVDRSVPPVPGRPPGLRIPEIQRHELANGVSVITVRHRRVPLIHIELLLPGGASAFPVERAGLPRVMASLLDEGTATRSSLEVAEAVEGLGADLTASAEWDDTRVALKVLRSRLPAAIDLMADIVRNPSFPQDDLERTLAQARTAALQRLADAGPVAGDALAAELFGEHPYAAPLGGTPESLAGVTRAEIVEAYRTVFRPDGATLVVVGDIAPDTVLPLLDRAFGDWSAPSASMPARALAPPARAGGIYLIDRPGAPQSEIRIGRVGVSRSTPDYFAILVLNTVLGGSFTSRLNRTLREERGYTYGAGSSFAMRVDPGPFVAGAAVHTPATADAVVLALAEIRRLTTEPVPADELERARNYVALRQPRRFETLDGVAARIAELVRFGLPDDTYDTYVDSLLAVSADEVLDAARRHLRADELVVVIAGDRAVLEGALAEAGLGFVTVLPPPP